MDRGHKPAVVSAILKLHATELLRRAVTDGMDVMGGAALCRGPRNLIARGHAGAPINITVEGANILTRTLIVYGQGAIRCHPYAQAEIRALEAGDGRRLVSCPRWATASSSFGTSCAPLSSASSAAGSWAARCGPARALLPAAGLGLGALRGGLATSPWSRTAAA